MMDASLGGKVGFGWLFFEWIDGLHGHVSPFF
jgi:hypothetical protein